MINTGKGVCASIHYAVISYGVRLRVARSTWMGTCQSLELRSGHLVWLSRFFRINQSNAKEGVRQQQCRIVSDSSGISIHYDYWDQFVKEWMGGKYARALHVPEPWWGWCAEDGALHSVTVNLMPGRGGKLQERRCMGCISAVGRLAYSTMMADGSLREHLRDTEQWHLNRRYTPLMHAIGAVKDNIAKDTRHHLSVELSPFHDTVNNQLFTEKHREAAIRHTLLFAAEASMLIESPDGSCGLSPLKNIVIVRSSLKNITKIAGEHIFTENISIELAGKSTTIGTFRLSEELYPHVSDVLFVCLSGSRNNLPTQQNLTQIINIINHQSKQQ